jgi:hypothetical protein
VFSAEITDTTGGSVTVKNPEKTTGKLTYDWDQLYLVKFADGGQRYYYSQDSLLGNWLTRDEMRMYMKGEADARKGYKAKGALWGSSVVGLLAGMSGSFWAPLAPYGFMALSGLPKVRIKRATVSDAAYLRSDAYIMGYERVARQKLKLKSLIGGTAGLLLGYGFYFAFHERYPETLNVGIRR